MDSAQASALTVQSVWLDQPRLQSGVLLMNVRTEAIFVCGAAPTAPRELLITADMTPATAVPCLSQALTGLPSCGLAGSSVTSVPVIWLRSGWFCWTPVSRMTVMTDELPRE